MAQSSKPTTQQVPVRLRLAREDEYAGLGKGQELILAFDEATGTPRRAMLLSLSSSGNTAAVVATGFRPCAPADAVVFAICAHMDGAPTLLFGGVRFEGGNTLIHEAARRQAVAAAFIWKGPLPFQQLLPLGFAPEWKAK